MTALHRIALSAALAALGLSFGSLPPFSPPAQAQGASVGFSGLKQDPGAQVEVTSDSLTIDRATGGAVLEGNVLVVQGALRLTAARLDIRYKADNSGIETIKATGGVTLVTAADAAEAREAVYDIVTGGLVMSGDVLLTQGPTTIAGERLVADLRAGTGRMEGRVRTMFKADGKAAN